jgi:soluble lytic murein transglycosylase-like protein
MTFKVGDYTYTACHNSKRGPQSTLSPLFLAAAVALASPAFATVGEARGASMYMASEAPSAAEAPVSAVRQSGDAGLIRAAAAHGSSPAVVAMVTEAAERHGVPVALAHAIIKIESGYNCRAHSRYGAAGIGQVLPSSARAEGVSGNLYDCGTGLEASMRYLKHAVTLYGAGCEAASAYNAGLSGRGRCTGFGRRAMRLAQFFR